MEVKFQAGMSWEGGLESKYSKRSGQKAFITGLGRHIASLLPYLSRQSQLVQIQIQEKGMWTPLPDGGQRTCSQDFLGGAVVKNLPANAVDTGSNPGPGRSHIPQSN